MLNDRFVSQNGILLMGSAALAMMLLTQGSVKLLIVLYSINMFITFVLAQLGMVRHWWRKRKTAGNSKGEAEIEHLQTMAKSEVERYVDFVKREGYYAKGFSAVGIDVTDEIEKMAPKLAERFPNMVCFGGQVVFPRDSFLSRWLHNYTVFAIQRIFYQQGIPFVVLPIRV
ncbi:MAG: hypothetical protein ACREOI_26845 [bacterium]